MWVDIKPSKKRVSLICCGLWTGSDGDEDGEVMMRYIKEGNLQWTMVGRWCVSNCKIHRTHSNYPSHLICEMRWQSLKLFFYIYSALAPLHLIIYQILFNKIVLIWLQKNSYGSQI